MSEHDELISQFSSITGAPPSAANQILDSASWNLEEAIRLFYESEDAAQPEEESQGGEEMDDEQGAGEASQQGQPPRSSRPPPSSQPRLRTLRDLQGSSAGGDSDDEDDTKQDFFAGGEKSGLAVQNPNNSNNNNDSTDHFNNIMNQARQNRPRPGDHDEPAQSSNFGGRAQTLGGDDAPSQVVNDPETSQGARRSNTLPRVTRTLHLWADGFSVDDGELYRFDDPANAPTLALINSGRAPLALLGVEPGQEVDLQLVPHKDENYVKPKKKYKPFEGQGQRLGSPTPGPSNTTATAPIQQSGDAAANPASGLGTDASPSPSVSLDESQPTISLQVRLGDGTRVSSRFNTSHTVGDVYDFVSSASSTSTGRAWVLMTTFPSKELSDKTAKLGDLSDFKRGGVVVQKWT